MSVKTHFLGWDDSVVNTVQSFLLNDKTGNEPVDLEDTLIVTPTRQAGRRLREALALNCADKNSTLLSARIVTPAWFLRNKTVESQNTASTTLTKAVWSEILMDVSPEDCSEFLPNIEKNRDDSWALYTAGMLQGLRTVLADAGLSISDVPKIAGNELQEPDRWKNMADLEDKYLARMNELGLSDQLADEIIRADSPILPDNAERVVVAAVPAPTPLMLRAIKSLSQNTHVDVLVHAPVDMKDMFDDWGRPINSKWSDHIIDIPDADMNVILAGTPESQADTTLQIISDSQSFGPGDIAIGVADRSVLPFMESTLASNGLPAFDPAEKSISEHSLFKLIEALCKLYTERSYEAFASLLRHPDFLNYCQFAKEVNAETLLTNLDEFQNYHLPMSFDDIKMRFTDGAYNTKHKEHRYPALANIVEFSAKQLKSMNDLPLEESIRSFLETIYDVKTITDHHPDDEELKRVATVFDTVMKELAESAQYIQIDNKKAVGLLLERLASESYPRERESSIVDLEGWLELAWNDAPLMIVTGVNEGSIPDTHLSDVFLPDSLRQAIGLPYDQDRLTRDMYLMTDIIQSRSKHGRAVFIAGKTSVNDDPLKPSRLLFRCRDEELHARVDCLFGDIKEQQKNYAFNLSFQLNPAPPFDFEPRRLNIKQMSATRFQEYLKCPFRFYLKYILGMKELNDRKRGLDGAEFGTLIHDVMDSLGRNKQLNKSSDRDEVTEFLLSQAETWINNRFGNQRPLPITIMLDTAKQRLKAVAKVQTKQVEQGWVITAPPEKEYVIENLIGMKITGRIDRIDRHIDTEAIRIIDYKTSDNPAHPAKSHISRVKDNTLDIAKFSLTEIKDGKESTKEHSWTNLQLPLYKMLLEKNCDVEDTPIEVAYFNIPKAVGDTGIEIWEDLNDDHMIAAAQCAVNIIKAIQKLEFWPPSTKPTYDDYESLFFDEMQNAVKGDELMSKLLSLRESQL